MKMLALTASKLAEELLREAEGEDVAVLRDGHPVALLTPMDDDEMYWYLREQDPGFIKSIADARADIAAGHGMPQEELEKELGI